MQLPGHSPVCTQIKCSQLAEYFQAQWSQYLALQRAGLLTDITLHMRDGSISLHQAVLVPLSSLLLSMTETPMVIHLPGYDLSTAQGMVSMLYTGSCLHHSSASYSSLLSMLSSLGINLSPSSLVLCPTDYYNHKKFGVGTASNDGSACGSTDMGAAGEPVQEDNGSQSCKSDEVVVKKENCSNELNNNGVHTNAFPCQRLASEYDQIAAEVLCSDCGSVSCQCPGNEGSDSLVPSGRTDAEEFTNFEQRKQNKITLKLFEEQLKLPKFNIKYRGNDGQEPRPSASNSVGGNCCPLCGVRVAGGMSKYRAHLVEKHFYMELSTMLGTRFNKQCPVCDKTIELRGNLVKHLGIVHKYVDQMLNVDINQNSTNLNTNNVDDMEDPPKLVIDDDFKEDEEPLSAGDLESELPSPANQFICTICRCSRKTEFRLLQHYSVTHFRTNLEEQFGLQFVTSNGCCPVCRKVMKNLYCFLIHIGAAHGEVSQYLEKEQHHQESPSIKPLNKKMWFCPVKGCETAKYSNKCFLMKHFVTKHYSHQLSAILQPLYEASTSCEACGKKFSTFHQFLVHCSVTHRMVLAYCSQVELDSLEGQIGVKHIVGRDRRVEGDKTFPCQLCGKAFINNYLLRKHYTAKHFYDALKSDFVSSISSGMCEKCGQEHPGSRMVQHLGVSHNQVDRYVEDLSREVIEPEVMLDCQ